jgi:hypothetical protein
MIRARPTEEVVVHSAAQGFNNRLETINLRFQLATVASPKPRLPLCLVLANTAISSAPATGWLNLVFENLVTRSEGRVLHTTFDLSLLAQLTAIETLN